MMERHGSIDLCLDQYAVLVLEFISSTKALQDRVVVFLHAVDHFFVCRIPRRIAN